jgi:hypothetical protein
VQAKKLHSGEAFLALRKHSPRPEQAQLARPKAAK